MVMMMAEPKIVEDERLLKLLKPYERAPKLDVDKYTEEFKRLINDKELEPNLDKCIFPNCPKKVLIEIPIKRGLTGLCNFHWGIVASLGVEWGEVKKRKKVLRSYLDSLEYPLKLRDSEKEIGAEHIYGPIDFIDTNIKCGPCGGKMISVIYKNNSGKIIKLHDCLNCGHMEEHKA